MCVLCVVPECEKKTSDFVASNRRTTLRFVGFRVTDERGPDPGTGVCTTRKGAVNVTGGCGGYSLDGCQVYSPAALSMPGFFQSAAQFARKE